MFGLLTLKIELFYLYIEANGLQFVNVSDAAGVEKCLNEGYTNRSIAATKMNEYSSRAHTIATVYLRKVNSFEKKTLSSQMNIVDLAGRYVTLYFIE